MAQTYQDYTATGQQTTFAIPFDRIKNSHVYVYVNGTLQPSTAYSIVGNTVVFVNAPANNATIRIQRLTDSTERLVDFVDGSRLNEENLDTDSKQAFFLIQERKDANDLSSAQTSEIVNENALNKIGTSYWKGLGLRLASLGNPTNNQDAATKVYVDAAKAALESALNAVPAIPAIPSAGSGNLYLAATAGGTASWQSGPSLSIGPVATTGSSVQRYLSDRFADIVNVKDFGALGNNIADDGPAIRAAKDYAVANNKTLYFPSGTYRVLTAINTNNIGGGQIVYYNNESSTPKKISIVGDDATIVTPLYATRHTMYNEFTFVKISGNYDRINISGLTFKSEQPLSYANYTSWSVPVEGCNGRTYGMTLSAGSNGGYPKNVLIENCTFIDNIAGIRADRGQYVVINNNRFLYTHGYASVGSSDWTTGISARQIDGLVVTNNYLNGCTQEYIDPSVVTYADYRMCADGLITCFSGPEINPAPIITNNYLRNFTREGINSIQWNAATANRTNPASGIIIANNHFDGWLPEGTRTITNWGVRNNAPFAVIKGNSFKQVTNAIMCSYDETANPESGSGSHYSLIDGNLIVLCSYNRPGFEGTLAGISVASYGTVVQNNHIIGFGVQSKDQLNWDGNYPVVNLTGDMQNISIPVGIAMTGGDTEFGCVVQNNKIEFVSKNGSTVTSAFTYGAGSGKFYLKNNFVRNSDFAFLKYGGNEWFTLCEELKFIDGRRLHATYGEGVTFPKHTFSIYPTQTGWYKLVTTGRRAQHQKVTISVSGESIYGDTSQNAATNGYQKTGLELASFTNSDSNTRLVCTQLYHSGGTTPAVSKVYLKENYFNAEFYLYVGKVASVFELAFSGGGISGSDTHAKAKVTVINGVVQNSVTILDQGSGYESAPTITIAYPNAYQIKGSGAVFVPTIVGGKITAITVTNGGSGYSQRIDVTCECMDKHERNADTIQDVLASSAPSGGYELAFKNGFQAVEKTGSTALKGTGTPDVGTSAPATPPTFVGQQFIDTTNGKLYVATGVSGNSDWKIMN